MTKIDQFESVFKSAVKTIYKYQPIAIGKILVATDLQPEESHSFQRILQEFLRAVGEKTEWHTLSRNDFGTVRDLLNIKERIEPDLVCTYRHLHSDGWKLPYGLGNYLVSLIQTPNTPVLVLPHPKSEVIDRHAISNTNNVTVITDHLTGNHALVNMAVAFTEPEGRLYLTHVEDSHTFHRYMEIIEKIPGIETDEARAEIEKRLLREPHDYIQSCAAVLREQGLSIHIEEVVQMGHHLNEYKRFTQDHEVDLLVMNAKEEDQIAIHGIAYPLLVELRSIPVLVL